MGFTQELPRLLAHLRLQTQPQIRKSPGRPLPEQLHVLHLDVLAEMHPLMHIPAPNRCLDP
jgi:hypothetical protein